MKLIHLGTRVESVFGKLDDEGNVIEQIPIGATTPYLTEAAFAQICDYLVSQKATLAAEGAAREREGETDHAIPVQS